MKSSVGTAAVDRRLTVIVAAVAVAMLAVLAIATRAQATERIYWDNNEATPAQTIAFANPDGSGGGSLNLSGATVESAEGLTFDPLNGRIYTASFKTDQIVYANVDGSGAGVVNTNGAEVNGPVAVVVDPATQTIYWSNLAAKATIGWAQLNGSAGGTLSTTGAATEFAVRLAIDVPDGRLYWASPSPGGTVFGWANLDGSGSGRLSAVGAPQPEDVDAIAVDPTAGRLYWIDGVSEQIGWTNLSGVGGGTVESKGAKLDEPFGMAFDPSSGRFYWGNYAVGKVPAGAIGTATLAGGGGGSITPTAPVAGPQDPVLLKSPVGTAAPGITQNVAALSCSQGGWSQDYPGSFVYAAPTSYSYQWLLNGQAIPGASAATYTATAAGSYTCAVTGKNVTGSATQTSSAVTVTAASLSAALTTKKVHARAGKAAVVRLRIANSGELPSAPISVCAALTKKAKKGLVAPKCASVGVLGSGGAATATLRVKTKKGAKGTYKFTTQVKGATVKPVTVSVKVTAAKKRHRK